MRATAQRTSQFHSKDTLRVTEGGISLDERMDVVVPWYHMLHTWSGWEITTIGPIMAVEEFTGVELKVGEYAVQERYCKVCNRVQVETIKSLIGK